MACSKDMAVKLLVDKKLVKPNMELYTPIPTLRLTNTIDRLTKIAKNVYNVDMGPLFNIRFREVTVGNYLIEGSAAIKTKVRVEPNEAAFEAIDRSEQQKVLDRERQLEDYRQKQREQARVEYEQIQEEGNFMINSEGDVVVPTSLPKINIKC